MSKLKGSILSILFLGMLVFPNISSASTIAELTAMLNSLLAQVASLQQQIVQQTGDSTQEWCHTFNTNLKYGDSEVDVLNLQTALEKEGFNISGEKIGRNVGYFGEETASAVVGFQQKYKSEVLTPVGLSYGTGYVGASTRKKLNQLYGCGITPVPVPTCVNKCGDGVCAEIVCQGIGCPCAETKTSCPQDCSPTKQPSITVVYPNGGERLEVGETYTIKWNTSGYDSNTDVQIGIYDTRYSTEGGTYPENTIVFSTKNTGSYTWTIPNNLSVDYDQNSPNHKIKVYIRGESPIGDESDNPFYLISSTATTVSCTDSDNGSYFIKGTTMSRSFGEEASDFCWNYQANNGICTGKNGCVLTEHSCNTDGSIKEERYSCPNGCREGTCVTQPEAFLTITSPSNGDDLIKGKTYEVTWTGSEFETTNYYVYLAGKELGPTGNIYLGTVNPVNGIFKWTVPTSIPAGSGYQIQVTASTVTESGDSSDDFNILSAEIGAPISVVSPNGGEKLKVGETYIIKWNTSGYDANTDVQIGIYDTRYSTEGGAYPENTIVFSTKNTGSYAWTIPSDLKVDYDTTNPNHKIKIYVRGGSPIGDESDNPFYLISSNITTTGGNLIVLSPNGGEEFRVGNTYEIKWSGGTSESIIDIYLFDWEASFGTGTYSPVSIITTYSLNDGSYLWSVPSTLQQGDYLIRILDRGSNAGLDGNNLPFSIMANSTTSQKTQANQMANILESARGMLEQMLNSLR